MSYEPKDHIFLYNGYALGAGGRVEVNDKPLFLNTPASVLSITGGGEARSRSENVRFGKKPFFRTRRPHFFMHIGMVETEAIGGEVGDNYVTTTRSVVRGLNVNNVLTADLVVGQTKSIHRKSGRYENGDEPSVIVEEPSTIEGLKIHGRPVKLTKDRILPNLHTFRDLNNAVSGLESSALNGYEATSWRKAFRKQNLMDPDDTQPPYVRDLANASLMARNVVRCSIFDSVKADGCDNHGYSVEVPEFGRIFFGELFVNEGMKRLSMIRIDLGCTFCGSANVGQNGTNGETFP
ncbi:MAG TPA: hypothetical protein VFN10_20615 [Thermoanaerobaculia bacterium]|nr:hypothetical protein [Thermoanaerobaculia bacterium]